MLTPRFAAVLFLALAGAVPSRAADLDPLLPVDTESYLTVNVRQIIESPLFQKQLHAPLQKMLDDADPVRQALKDLGIDPFKDIDRLTIAAPSAVEPDRGLVILQGKFDVAKVENQGKEAAKNFAESFKLHSTPIGGGAKANIYEITVQKGQDMALFVTVVNAKTIVLSPGKDYVVDALKQNALNAKAALKNKEIAALIEKMDPKQSVSVAILGKSLAVADNDLVPKVLTDSVGKVDALGGGVTINDDLKLELLLATPDTDSAVRMRNGADKALKWVLVGLSLTEDNKGLSLLLDLVKSIKITNRGRVVSVTGKLTSDLVEDFFKKDG